MRLFIRFTPALLAFALLVIHLEPASAAEFALKRTDEGLDLVFVQGEIEEGDDDHFRRLAVSSDEALIILGSPGGALVPALEIGRTIQLKGFTTYVPAGVECTSSCALIWIAGARRLMATNGRVGFHASYRTVNGQQEEVGVGNAIVGRYLTLLNLSERAIIFATSASPTTVTWLTSNNSVQAGIPFEAFDLPDDGRARSGEVDRQSAQSSTTNKFEWYNDVWSVWSTDNGCNMTAMFTSESGVENTSFVSVFMPWQSQAATLMIVNQKFRSLTADREYQLEIVFQKGEKIDAGWGERAFTARDADDMGQALHADLAWGDLKAHLERNDKIAFFRGGDLIDVYPLKGSIEAIKQLQVCGRSGASAQLEDPFAR